MIEAAQKHMHEVPEVIEGLLKSYLDPVHMVSVEVREEIDPDGDQVLHVIVVYETNDIELDPSRISGFLRRLRPVLSEGGENRFPVMSFIAQEDYAGAA